MGLFDTIAVSEKGGFVKRARRRILGILGFFAVIFVLGMGSDFYQDFIQPKLITATPTSRPTEIPTKFVQIQVPPTPTANSCFSWEMITTKDIGKTVCVYGTVYAQRLMSFGGARIVFDQYATFFLVSPDFFFPDVKEGDCVTAVGLVEQSTEGRLFINIGDSINFCETP